MTYRRDLIDTHLKKLGVSDPDALNEHRKMLAMICPNDPEKYHIIGNPNSVQPINVEMG